MGGNGIVIGLLTFLFLWVTKRGNDHKKEFESLNTQIIGLSKCSIKKHDNFVAKQELNFPLASDENSDVCEQYGVWKEKSMYGKKFWGIERSTFLIDEQNKIIHIWRKVKVPGHVEEIVIISVYE